LVAKGCKKIKKVVELLKTTFYVADGCPRSPEMG
jgi:hypothetical protein